MKANEEAESAAQALKDAQDKLTADTAANEAISNAVRKYNDAVTARDTADKAVNEAETAKAEADEKLAEAEKAYGIAKAAAEIAHAIDLSDPSTYADYESVSDAVKAEKDAVKKAFAAKTAYDAAKVLSDKKADDLRAVQKKYDAAKKAYDKAYSDYMASIAVPSIKDTVTSGRNGTASIDNADPETGEAVSISIRSYKGYTVSSVKVTDADGNSISVEANDDGTFTFTQPDGAADVDVTFTKAIDLYRLYNPNSGEHVFTGETAERDNLIGHGWRYKGVAYGTPEKTDIAIYRVYNPNAGDHHYTTDKAEVDMLVRAGWRNEGFVMSSSVKEKVYRRYNPNAFAHNHHYTTSAKERDDLIVAGWRYEGVGWYAAD